MPTINCDNCERPFEPPNPDDTKVACPYCGDVHRVDPVNNAEASTADGPRVASADVTDLIGKEKVLATIRPAMFRAHPWRWLAIIVGAIAGLVLAGWALFDATQPRWYNVAGLVISGVAAVFYALWWVGTHWWMRLEVTNKRTVRYVGIIKRHSTEVLHDHVRSVDIRQSLLERVFNVGDVGIDSAGQDGIEIEVSDIPAPYRVKELIDQHRKM